MKSFVCRLLIPALGIGWAGYAQAQQTFRCYYTENKIGDMGQKLCDELKEFSLRDNAEAVQILQRILTPVGLRPNFVLQPCDGIENCVATIGEDGLRYIIYDRVFMRKLIDSTRNDWVSLSIFAHEVLHHLNQHTHIKANLEKRRELELEADEWSGRILGLLGATLQEAQSGMEILEHPAEETFSSHPTKERRLEAIAKGWQAAASRPTRPAEKLSLSDMMLQQHDFAKITSLDHLPQYWSKGMELRQLLHIGEDWFAFFARPEKPATQQLVRHADYKALLDNQMVITPAAPLQQTADTASRPDTEEAAANENDAPEETETAAVQAPVFDTSYWKIRSITWYNGEWIAVREKVAQKPDQELWLTTRFDPNDLNLKKATGQIVQEIAYGKGQWLMLLEDAEEAGCEDQLVLITNSFPNDEIRPYWRKRYLVTTTRFLNNEWITILQKFDATQPVRVQAMVRNSTFPLNNMLRHESDGYFMEQAAYDGRYWGYIMTKIKPINQDEPDPNSSETLLRSSGTLPR